MSDKANSTEALVNTAFNINAQKEKSIELLQSVIKNLSIGNDVTPVIVTTVNGQLLVEQCKVDDDGNISLPELKLNSKEDIELKSKFVRKVLKKITPVLHADIENVTYLALMRKDKDRLERMFDAINSGTKIKLENRVGCIFLIVGDDEFLL